MVTSPGPNTIVCKQLQPSHGTSLLDISVADVANMDAVAWKFVETEELLLLQMLTTLQTSCLVHTTPVVVESEAIVV